MIGDPFIAPAATDGERRKFSAPMTLTGQLSAFPNFEGTGSPVFSVSVLGQGRVLVGDYIFLTSGDRETWRLMSSAIGGFELTTDSTAPVPEPATMVLLGTGLVAAGWRSRRQRATEKGVSRPERPSSTTA